MQDFQKATLKVWIAVHTLSRQRTLAAIAVAKMWSMSSAVDLGV